jgi:HK97 family phage major capsid protein
MNKERLEEIKNKLVELRSEIDVSEDAEEIKAKGEEIETLEKEREEIIKEAEEKIEEEAEARAKEIAKLQFEDAKNKELEAREKVVLGSFGMKKLDKGDEKMKDKYSSQEYRMAFMDYVLRGKEIPAELREDATTSTTDLSAVIPTTLMNKIIQDVKSYGHIISRVTQTNFKGGLEIPTSDSRPTATWTAEGSVSAKQKKTVTGKVSFLYYKLQCRVATNLEADTVSLDVFEQQIVADIKEAMTIAIETAIISGDGDGEPTGILNSSIPAGQTIEVTADEIGSWEKWSKIFAKLPLGKRSNVALILNSETFEGNLDGAVDKNGQPIARTNYGQDGSVNYRFKGKESILVEGLLPAFDDAEDGDVFGIVGNLKDYYLNSNLQMRMRRYFDEDLDQWVNKATLIADGKVVSTQGFLLLKKASSETSI